MESQKYILKTGIASSHIIIIRLEFNMLITSVWVGGDLYTASRTVL